MTKFKVMRQHFGDKAYAKGDEREANETDVAHLVARGVLVKAAGEKAEREPKNKAEPAPENKGGRGRRTKVED